MNLFNPFSLACCDNLRFCSVVSLANLIRSLAYTQRGCCTPLKFNSSSLLKRDHLKRSTYSSRHPFFRGNSLFIFLGSVWWVFEIRQPPLQLATFQERLCQWDVGTHRSSAGTTRQQGCSCWSGSMKVRGLCGFRNLNQWFEKGNF